MGIRFVALGGRLVRVTREQMTRSRRVAARGQVLLFNMSTRALRFVVVYLLQDAKGTAGEGGTQSARERGGA